MPLSIARTSKKDPWRKEEKLVLGFDVGTTCSAVSYSHLLPGSTPSVTRVSQWPGQAIDASNSRVPSKVYYDSEHTPKLVGAEADGPHAEEISDDLHLTLVEHFKLNLHPSSLTEIHKLHTPPDLPPGVSIEKVYEDFFDYLLRHTREFFVLKNVNGDSLWVNLFPTSDIIIAHPNEWGLREQTLLQNVAIAAGLVSEFDWPKRLYFVSEAEASVHFCLQNANLADKFKTGTKFILCDAGGSTVDITSYVIEADEPGLLLHEAKPSGCVQAGGIYVNQEATTQLEARFLRHDAISTETAQDWIAAAATDFEFSLKPRFPDASDRYTLQVAPRSYKNPDVGIKFGRLQLSAEEVASFFDPSISSIKEEVAAQLDGFAAEHILLVGGYGESRYLQRELSEAFEDQTCEVSVLNEGSAKAVSDGAVLWRIYESVTARITRYSFGMEGSMPFNPDLPSHRLRPVYVGLDGYQWVAFLWCSLIQKGTLIKETDTDVVQSYSRLYPTIEAAAESLAQFRDDILSYPSPVSGELFCREVDKRGNKDGLSEGFKEVCRIRGDLSAITKSLEPKAGQKGTYYKVDFDISISFGGTQLQARYRWYENGELRTGPVTLIPGSLRE